MIRVRLVQHKSRQDVVIKEEGREIRVYRDVTGNSVKRVLQVVAGDDMVVHPNYSLILTGKHHSIELVFKYHRGEK